MLIRVAPRFFQADTGDTITIAAIAQNNNGFEGATYQYAGAQLTSTQVQNHPACQFVVQHGPVSFVAMLLFDQTSPNASYDLFEVDPAGNLVPLQVNAPAFAGLFTQFQVNGLPVASLAAATRGDTARMAGAAPPAAPMARAAGQPMAAAAPQKKAPRKKAPGRKKAKKGRKNPR